MSPFYAYEKLGCVSSYHACRRSWASSGSTRAGFPCAIGTASYSYRRPPSVTPNSEQLLYVIKVLHCEHVSIVTLALSMDSRRGSELFRFDMSLMERLAKAGLSMSQIDVQRRMRPTISNLIRFVVFCQ
jgi:hypothetical protein